jgi:hypothetical protein
VVEGVEQLPAELRAQAIAEGEVLHQGISKIALPGPAMIVRAALPCVNRAGTAKAVVSNHRMPRTPPVAGCPSCDER